MKHITGGALVVKALQKLNVDTVFAIASIHNLSILEAIRDAPEIRVIMTRHEQGAVHAADGYSRATGKLGVAIASTGPGTANTAGGLFEAEYSSSSVLLITGQIESQFYGQGKGFIHEAERQLEMLTSLTKRSWSVRRAEDIGNEVIAAGKAALSGRRGPTAIEIPVDFQYEFVPNLLLPDVDLQQTVPNSVHIKAAIKLISKARRPLIWVGGGVVAADASEELLAFVEKTNIPVLTTVQGRGAIPENHPLWLSAKTFGRIPESLEAADVVIAFGTRFQYNPTRQWSVRPGEKLIHIDIDPSVMGRSYPYDVAIVADAKVALQQLINEVPELDLDTDWVSTVTNIAREAREEALEALGPDHGRIAEIIRRNLPEDGAIVRDSTIPAYFWGDALLPVLQPRTSMFPSSAAIGPGLPLAIGAALGRNEVSVVIHGDGGIMLSIGELVVLAESKVPLIVLVFNDKSYGVLKGIQGATFDSNYEFVDLHSPDFVALSEAMGVQAYFADSVETFESKFAQAVEQGGMCLIEVDMLALGPMNVQIGAHRLVMNRQLEEASDS